MQTLKFDRKTLAVVILIAALAGLGAVQYRMVVQYYDLSRAKLEQQISVTLSETADENHDRTLLSNLISAIITQDTLRFPIPLDSLQRAGTRFYRMYLTDRFNRANIPVDFEFAVHDHISMYTYLQSAGYTDAKNWPNRFNLPLAGVIATDCSCAPVLDVRFNSLQALIFSGIQPIIFPALACFVLLILGFVLLLRILREQKYLDRVKNDFINNLTHELKTPVFSISLAMRLIREKNTGDIAPYVSQVEKDLDHLKGNVDKVLELASIEDKKGLLKIRKMHIQDLIDRWVKEFENTPSASRIRVENKLTGSVTVMADEEHLKNALNNLVDNALKYDVTDSPVDIVARRDGRMVTLSVTDRGPGIERTEQEMIFNKFYRVNNGNTTARGYGLGLSYVRQVIQMMKGHISVRSAPGEGSSFEIKLPIVS